MVTGYIYIIGSPDIGRPLFSPVYNYKFILSRFSMKSETFLAYFRKNQYFFQQDGMKRIRTGKSSRRPASISKISTHFEKIL